MLALRARQQRNLLATLLLSRGVPMLLGGDELGRSQAGNNNAYCQDNETSWYDWRLVETGDGAVLLEFTRRVAALRRAHPALRANHFLRGTSPADGGLTDVAWFRVTGEEMAPADWGAESALGMRLAGLQGDESDTLLALFNASAADVAFTLPSAGRGTIGWETLLDTRHQSGAPLDGEPPVVPTGATRTLVGRSLVVLRAVS